MSNLSTFLVENEVQILFVCMISAFLLFAFIEDRRPRATQSRHQLRHRWLVNFGLVAVNQFNVIWLTAFLVVFWRLAKEKYIQELL